MEDLDRYLTAFTRDRDDRARAKWLISSKDARAFMENDFTPLERDGLIDVGDPETPIVKISSIPEKIRFLKGRIFFNPILPEVAPYEGETLDESARMIAEALFRYEMNDKRGPFELNIMEEIDQVVQDALVGGWGVLQLKGDDTLRDELFYLGKPVYQRLDPQKVFFDSRAHRNNLIRRLHIVNHYTEDEFKEYFPKVDLSSIPADFIDSDPETNEDLFAAIETQELKVDRIKKRVLPPEIQQEIGLNQLLISDSDLRAYLKELKFAHPGQFDYIQVNDFINSLDKLETTDWGVYSILWAGGYDKPLSDKTYIGSRFNVERLGFFPINNKPYFYGVPYYLRSPQAMQIIANTIYTRLILRADKPGGFYDESAFTPEELERLQTNRIGDFYGLKGFDTPLRERLILNDPSKSLPFVNIYMSEIANTMNNAFGTWREQMGRHAFAGQSGKSVEVLTASGSYMFFHFVKEINQFLPKVFRQVLDLAMQYTPSETLAIIAGEAYPDRLELIKSGRFIERMRRVNVKVQLDTTTEGERNTMRQIVAQLLMRGSMAPYSGFRELEFKNPTRLAKEMDAWMARQSTAEYYAQLMEKYPELKEAFSNIVKEHQKLTAGNTQQI